MRAFSKTLPRVAGALTPTRRAALLFALISLAAAALAAHIVGAGERRLYNLDLPKIDLPLAIFYNEALRHGELPLWNDRLGLGFPLYAEGQIGAFYPPNWLIFRLDPLAALDVTRVLHLVLAGVGTGLLALRLSGSRAGAAVAAATAVLSGGIVTKLEWTNLVVAYAWAPWILLPLVRAPVAWAGVAASGALWGVQALAGHPNTWLLTGFSAAAVLLGTAPRWSTVPRLGLFGSLGVALGAVQLLPTLLLVTLSARSGGLSADDLFASAATPFDGLLFAFAGAFLRNGQDGAWDLYTNWYPNGTFSLLEAWAYVGIPVLALAAIGWRARRGRGLRLLIVVLLAIPIVAAFRPELWTRIPLLNGLRSPTRAYLFVDLGIAILAALAFVRLRRGGGAPRTARTVAAVAIGWYVVVAAIAAKLPATFGGLLVDLSTSFNFPPERIGPARELALASLVRLWPVGLEILLAAAFAVLVSRAARGRLGAWPLAALAIVPLVLFTPAANPMRGAADLVFAGNDLHPSLRALTPHRVLTIGEPGWYPGMPDQLAAAGVPDVRMFSSLNLAETDALVERLKHDPDATTLRRLVGIDTLVTFGTPCPGTPRAHANSDDAYICSVDALAAPYWIPAQAARMTSPSDVAWRPSEAAVDAGLAAGSAVTARVESRSTTGLSFVVDAPADGWVFVDSAWWPAWSTYVDDRPVPAARALAGQLVPLTAGTHTVTQRMVPLDALAGLVLGVIASGLVLAALIVARRRS